MFYSLALIAFIIDKLFAEFDKLKIKHPIIYIGDVIRFFENKFYKDTVLRGFLLVLFTLSIVFIVVYCISFIENIFFKVL